MPSNGCGIWKVRPMPARQRCAASSAVTSMPSRKTLPPSQRVLPEMSAKVSFLSQEVTADQQKPLLAVNPDALSQRDGRTVVFVVREGHAVAVPVTPGVKVGDATSVTGDVKSGDKVVAKPAPSLQSGALVKTAAK